MKSEHEIMLERLQKWRGEKGKGSTTKHQPLHVVKPSATVGVMSNRKPMCPKNSATKTMGSLRKSQRSKSSAEKRKPIKPHPSSAPRRQQTSPQISMSEKLELWKKQKEMEKSATKMSKRPWNGGGTPLITKSTKKQSSSDANTDVVEPSVHGKTHMSQNTNPTNKELEDTEIHNTFNSEISQSTVPIDLSGASPNGMSYDSRVVDETCIANVDVKHTSEAMEAIDNEDETDGGDFTLHSSLEPMEASPRIEHTNQQTSTKTNTPSCQIPKRRSSVRSCKREACKSALKQPNKMARLDRAREKRSVKFTTPIRCSPRLAKVGEGEFTLDVTPKNKKDMRERLQQWLLEKGKTPSRYSNLLNFQKNTPADRLRRERIKARMPTPARPLQSTSEETGSGSNPQATDEVVAKLNATLSECQTLLHEGCPVDHVSNWLDDICRRLPMVEQCAKYWLCRATAAEIDGDYDDAIGVFEEAAEAGAQPVEEIKEGLKDLVMRIGDKDKVTDDPSPSPSPVSSPPHETQSASPLSQQTPGSPDDVIPVKATQGLAQFSGLKYCLTDTTPLFKRVDATPYFTPGLMITPVRRSVRLESRRSFLPDNLQDHDICVSSLEDLPPDAPTEFILRPNRALEGEFTDTDDV